MRSWLSCGPPESAATLAASHSISDLARQIGHLEARHSDEQRHGATKPPSLRATPQIPAPWAARSEARHLFGFEVVLQSPAAELTPDTGLSEPAPGQLGEGGLGAIDPDDAGAQGGGHPFAGGWSSADITAAARPKRESLASRTASASVSNGATQSTGPKISSSQSGPSRSMPVRIVGSQK